MKVWTVEEIIEVLNNNDDQVCKALMRLYDRQTEEEKVSLQRFITMWGLLLMMPVFIFTCRKLQEYGRLSKKQIECCRRKIVKYKRQLLEIVNGR